MSDWTEGVEYEHIDETWRKIERREMEFPEIGDWYTIIPGMRAPNGPVGRNNPVYKQPVDPNLEGYKYLYRTPDGKESITITVEIRTLEE